MKADLWRQNKLGEKPAKTWDDAIARYFKEKCDKESIEHDRAMLNWSLKFLTLKQISEVTDDLLEKIIEARRQGNSSRTPNGVANSTINRHMEAIQRVLNMTVKWKWVTSVPKPRRLTEPEGRLRWLTLEEIDRLLKALPPHLNQMARFSLASGLRENNVLYLEWSQVDLNRKVCWMHADQTKAKKTITVPLSSEAIAVLRERKGIDDVHVFTYEGDVMSKASTNGWYRALKKANITGFTWHGLRHTWASYHVMNGTPLEVLQKLGGWASLDMVMKYAHLAPGHVASYAENSSATSYLRHSGNQNPHE